MRDGSERHRTSGKTFEDIFNRLHFAQRNGVALLEFKQTSDRELISGLVVDLLCILLICFVTVVLRRMLEEVNHIRAEQVLLTSSFPLIDTALLKFLGSIFVSQVVAY